MWAAVCSVIALVVVAVLNVVLVAWLGGPDGSPLGDVVKQAFWALQAPLAALLVAARADRKEAETMAEDAGGVNVLALVILYAIAIFVAIQLISFAFGAAVLFKDPLIDKLCALQHVERCLQIPPDALGAGTATTLFAGGAFAIAAAMIMFMIAGYRVGWRSRRLGWVGVFLIPPLTALLMLGENLLSLYAFGPGVDVSLGALDWRQLALARAPIGAVGIVFALAGWLWSLRLNRQARRYAFAVARASARREGDAGALRSEFLTVLGFSPKEHELVIRRRQNGDNAATKL